MLSYSIVLHSTHYILFFFVLFPNSFVRHASAPGFFLFFNVGGTFVNGTIDTRIDIIEKNIVFIPFQDLENDLFFLGEGNEGDDSIAFDLGVLRFSNATVITRGTFSMWGSVLCEGEYYTEYGPFVRSVTGEADDD